MAMCAGQGPLAVGQGFSKHWIFSHRDGKPVVAFPWTNGQRPTTIDHRLKSTSQLPTTDHRPPTNDGTPEPDTPPCSPASPLRAPSTCGRKPAVGCRSVVDGR